MATTDFKEAKVVKQAGFRDFVPNQQANDLPVSSENIAKVYRQTQMSLKRSLEEAVNSGSPNASKIESDLSDFYKSISNKYGRPISNEQDFNTLMDDVETQDDVFNDVKEHMAQKNESIKNDVTFKNESNASSDFKEIFAPMQPSSYPYTNIDSLKDHYKNRKSSSNLKKKQDSKYKETQSVGKDWDESVSSSGFRKHFINRNEKPKNEHSHSIIDEGQTTKNNNSQEFSDENKFLKEKALKDDKSDALLLNGEI